MNQNLLSFRWFSPPFFFFLLFIIFFLTEPGLSIDPRFGTCVPKSCSRNGLKIRYPFWIDDKQPSYCGYPGFKLTCRNDEPVLDMIDTQYIVRNISYEGRSLSVVNAELLANPCPFPLNNLTFNRTPFNISPVNYNLSILNCSTLDGQQLQGLNYFPVSCLSNHTIAVWDYPGDSDRLDLSGTCENLATVPLAMESYKDLAELNYSKVLQKGFLLNWTAMDCGRCNETGGQCGFNESISLFQCFCADRPHMVKCDDDRPNLRKKIIIGVCAGIGGFLLCVVIFISIRVYRKKYYHPSSTLLSRAISFDPSFKSDIEKSNSPYPTQFFNYKELEEATNNFDPSRELGDGGFGTVYHGMLHDGRSVAVKRLYESNYRRVEQFKNEINILSHLRHRNLVTLYGCSSRHSRELLLVYEYIPNGTVADHLHGDRVKPGALTWPIRMSIAIETADALKYLHAVEIIHRDVKTNNILLDNNFGVKVADFGLSRLFPTDVTHVSTAPQGTPGYVDPDYHRCYQLTDKSDVYSFGVVMIELISSKPAVDISRHRYEINLANMAINKIHNHALHELVDPTLGFDSDYEVKRMITLVAELAFRCLQDEKDVRPSMEEVLDTLNGIKNDGYKVEKAEDVGTPADDAVLLKNFPPLSPDTVTGAWESRTTTPNTSG